VLSDHLVTCILTVCVFQGHMIDVADLTQSIAGFEESIRKCKAMLFCSFFHCACAWLGQQSKCSGSSLSMIAAPHLHRRKFALF